MSQAIRRPVIAGIAQLTQKIDDPRLARSPLELMEQAIRDAAEDAGAPRLVDLPRRDLRAERPLAIRGPRATARRSPRLAGRPQPARRALRPHSAGPRRPRVSGDRRRPGRRHRDRRRRERKQPAPTRTPATSRSPGTMPAAARRARASAASTTSGCRRKSAPGLVNASTLFALCDTSLRRRARRVPFRHTATASPDCRRP